MTVDTKLLQAERSFATTPHEATLGALDRARKHAGLEPLPVRAVFERLEPVVAAGEQAETGPWAQLIRFVARWYQEPLQLDETLIGQIEEAEAYFKSPFPLCLREWFLLVGPRFTKRGEFRGSGKTSLCSVSKTELSRSPRAFCIGLTGLGEEVKRKVHVTLDVPSVLFERHWSPNHSTELLPDVILDVPVADYLTAIVMWETITHHESAKSQRGGPLGPRCPDAHSRRFGPCRTRVDAGRGGSPMVEDSEGVQHVVTAYETFLLGGHRFLGDTTGDTLGVVHPSRSGHSSEVTLATRSPQARKHRDGLHRTYERAWCKRIQGEYAAKELAEHDREAEQLAGSEVSDADLVVRLAAIENKLLRFQRPLVGDMRQSLASGLTTGQRLKALELLAKHEAQATP